MSHGRLRRVDIHDACPDGLGDGILIITMLDTKQTQTHD